MTPAEIRARAGELALAAVREIYGCTDECGEEHAFDRGVVVRALLSFRAEAMREATGVAERRGAAAVADDIRALATNQESADE